MSCLEISCIKTKTKCFISSLVSPDNFLVNGEKPKSTYHREWFEISDIPREILRVIPSRQINKRWELRKEFINTTLSPTLNYEDFFDEDGEPTDNYKTRGLYSEVFDIEPERTEQIEFNLNVIEELDAFEITKREFQFKNELLDLIQTPDVLLPTKPCHLSSKESYAVIRNHIKQNIDLRVAKITSDYDFCLTVKKNIELNQPITETMCYPFAKKSKDRERVVTRNTREITVFETAPDLGKHGGVHKGYTKTEEFHGRDYENLKENINNYLDNLMITINQPLYDCPHCDGRGVLYGKEIE